MAEKKPIKPVRVMKEKVAEVGSWFDTLKERLSDQGEAVLAVWFAGVERGVHMLVSSVFRRVAIFFFVLLGATFFLVGLARVLSALYELPGVGDIIVGTLIFSIVILLSMAEKKVTK